MKNITAVVVTYNRKVLLIECLNALLGQTMPLSRIIIIDNASTDGTYEYVLASGCMGSNAVNYVRMDRNEGGAGGFYRGMQEAMTDPACEAVWVMDDDTIPEKDCLRGLCDGYAEIVSSGVEPSFLASSVYGINGEAMNVPDVDDRDPEDLGYPDWYRLLKKGVVKIKRATFVSLLFPREAVEKCGLPCKHFFIWGDDTEYTTRMVDNFGPAYLVGQSVAIHKRSIAKQIALENETDCNRMKMFSYLYRNHGIIARYYRGERAYYAYLKMELRGLIGLILKGNVSAAAVVFKGLWQSFSEYNLFKNFIDKELAVS